MLCKKKETELLMLKQSLYPFARPEQPSILPISPPVLPHPSCSLLVSRRFPTGSHRFPRSWRRFPTCRSDFRAGAGAGAAAGRSRHFPSGNRRVSAGFRRRSRVASACSGFCGFPDVPAGKPLIPTGFLSLPTGSGCRG